jgi:hydroxymethylpyrimidine kinase/phosphomethylpyrimidine kinase
MKPFCLTIAGADPTSGAGIQADIRTFDRCGVHPFSVITALTYQSATEFYGYKSLSDELESQLEAIFSNYPIKFVKIGMIPDIKAIDVIVNYLEKFNLTVVFDPVTISSTGKRLSNEGIEVDIEKKLFPHVHVITPNRFEAGFYSNRDINGLSLDDVKLIRTSAEILLNKLYISKDKKRIEKAVVIKSAGENKNEIFDVALINKRSNNELNAIFQLFKKTKFRINENIHGTGCVFSSAITAFLANNYSLEQAIVLAEDFFDSKFQNFIELPKKGKIIDLTLSNEQIGVINQIKEIYNFISANRKFSKLIPEVRMNISGALPHAIKKEQIAGIEGRITIINGFPTACGEIKFGVSDHTARLILTAKEFDNSINFVINLKYDPLWIALIQERTELDIKEVLRKDEPSDVKEGDFSTMQWLIKDIYNKYRKIPDIIWDKGSIGKEPIIRLFGKNSKDIIRKLEQIINLI